MTSILGIEINFIRVLLHGSLHAHDYLSRKFIAYDTSRPAGGERARRLHFLHFGAARVTYLSVLRWHPLWLVHLSIEKHRCASVSLVAFHLYENPALVWHVIARTSARAHTFIYREYIGKNGAP